METLGIISFIVISVIISFLIGLAAMARYKQNERKPIEKPQTKNTLYAERVINAATQIYCNFNETKILRIGVQDKQKKQRQGESIQEALNLIGSIDRYFDMQDAEPPKKEGDRYIKNNLNIN